MASCTEDSIVAHVLPFVKEHLQNENWQFRDAAIMALGSIMEGPDPESMAALIEAEVRGLSSSATASFSSSSSLSFYSRWWRR